MIEAIEIPWIYAGGGFAVGLILTAAAFGWRVLRLERQNADLGAQNESFGGLELKVQTLEQSLQNARESAIKLEVERDSFQKQTLQHQEDLKKMEEILTSKFENLSNKIFEEKSEKFKKQSQESLGELLNPLKERINEFQKKVDDSFGKQASEQFSLKEQIKNIVDVHGKMTLQAENLAKALKSDSKTQGHWGEIILEKILEDAGLQKDVNYNAQGGSLGLKHPETGQHLKPDIVIYLPEDKHVIVDSKVSLTAYERFCTEEDESLKPGHLKAFLTSVRKHVSDLEQRRYQDTDKLGTPEIVLMFMPIEGAFMLALQQDRDLHQFAWDKRVAIVCPSTLFATLKTISSLWRLAKQNQNAQDIAKTGGALYDKIANFVEDMQGLGKQLKTVEKTYDGAMNKLSTGRGNILTRTENLKKLGAKTSKMLPGTLLQVEQVLEDMGEEENLEEGLDRQTGT